MKAPSIISPLGTALKHYVLAAGAGVLLAGITRAEIFTIPADLAPGDSYRLVFVTSGETWARSSAGGPATVAGYHAFAASAAASVPPLNALGTTWNAVVSTRNPNSNAAANTGTDPAANGTGVPIYNLAGLRVADNNADLWDGTLANPINRNELGGGPVAQGGGYFLVWTGDAGAGSSAGSGAALITQDGGYIHAGDATSTTGWAFAGWLGDPNTRSNDKQPIYAMSGILTVPEGGNPACDLLAFQWGESSGVIDQTAGTVFLTVPSGTDLTTLSPSCTVSSGATVSPVSGSAVDFTNSQTVPAPYTVTAANGVATRTYQVTVTIEPLSAACDLLTFNWGNYGAAVSGDNVTLVVPCGTDVTALAPTYTMSRFATQDMAYPSGAARDFTTARTYVITAQDGTTTRIHTVSVLKVPVTVPRGLAAGDPYRLVFATSTTRDALSQDIADYNAWVTAAAVAVPELFALGTTWSCLGSTAAVSANANTLTRDSDPGAPIYNPGGVRVADNNADLWDGTLANPVNFNELGATPASDVWTGTTAAGVRGGDWFLGDTGGGWVYFGIASYGVATGTNATWVANLGEQKTAPMSFYALSGILRVPAGGSPACNLLAFQWGACAGVIDQQAGAVSLTVPFGTDLTTLSPSCTVSSFASVSPAAGSPVDFTNSQATPVNHTVTAENGTATRTYQVTVTVTAPGTACDITGFNWESHGGVIDGTHIALSLPYGTDLATLNPTFTLSPGAVCDHVSGNAYDFSAAVFYIVTAQDGVTTRTYAVTVGNPFTEWIAAFDFPAFTNPDLTAAGDPDGDGMANIVEFAYGLDPTQQEDFSNCLTRERWEDIGGSQVADLTGNRERYPGEPDECVLVPGVDESGHGERYASRYRGFLTAPVTGTYYFWISGDDGAELWFADGTIKKTLNGQTVGLTNRYGKQRVASVGDARSVRNFTAFQDFDQLSCQHSGPVQLEAGQPYYFEVLHKQDGGSDHVAVTWQVPGAIRQIIPATAFNGNDTQADDLDDDNLPDAWEVANGLNPADNGHANPRDGQYGDWDSDGITNLGEYQLGTDPKSADTDGDGLSDKDERDYYHTDPLVSNLITAATYATLSPHNYASATGYWSRDASGSLTAIERRGEITYNFSVAQGDAGIFEIVLTGGAAGIPRPVENLPLVFSINGNRIGATTLTSLNGVSATATLLTPWLKAGSHTLTILHDNYRAALKLRIDSLLIRRLAGLDANGNQRPDWLEQRLATDNHLTRIPATSLTSPLCIEGVTAEGVVREGVNRRIPGLVLKVNDEPLAPTPSVDSSFYANVPLSESAPVTLTASFQSGALAESKEIIWSPTNLRAYRTLHIRKGDALRLDAWNNAGVPGNNTSFTVTMDGTLLADDQANTTHTSGQPFAVTFDTAGTHALVVTYGNKPPHTTTLHVHRANFGPALSVRAYHPRDWTPPSLSRDLTVQADSRLSWQETTATVGPRSFRVMPFEAAERHVIARIPEDVSGAPRAIVDRGTLNAFHLAYIDETADAVLVHTFPDGSSLMRGSIVAVGLPPDVYIRIISLFQGTLFINGANILWLTAADFDQNGIAYIHYEWDGEGDPKMCTAVDIFTTTPPPAQN